MRKSLFFTLLILAVWNNAAADDETSDSIVQRQSKQIQKLSAKVQTLDVRVQTLESTVENLKSALKNNEFLPGKALDDQLNYPHSPLKGETQENTQHDSLRAVGKNQSENRNEGAEKSDYELALASLKDAKLEEAEKLFADFMVKYPSGSLQSNAIFWYAESFYRRQMFKEALENYLRCYKNYPQGSKAPDSLLKIAYSFASLNKKKEACDVLLKLEQEFSHRPIESIKRAQEAKDKFQCK